MTRTDFVFVLVFIVLLVFGAWTIIDAVYDNAQQEPPAVLPTWQPPPISRCPQDISLWDCIRHSAYRRDI